MENREKKTLTGFCYWGGERKVNANGTFLYNGGMCVAVLLEERSQVNELREKVCGALNINFEGKMFFYNTKRDKTKYVTLNDDNGVAMLFHLNEDDVDLFVEDTRQNNDPICNTTYNSTRESMVTDNISSPGGIVALPFSSQINKEVELPLAKQMQSCNEKRDCGIRDSGNETYLSQSRRLQLQFMDKLSHPVLTRRAIKGEKNTSIGIALYDVLTGQVVNTGPEASTKVEIVVLEKDFNGHDWSLEEFNSKIVWKQGGGKTLLIGDVYVKLKKGIGSIGNIHFKHTKRWMKKIEFRLGARIVDVALGHRVREAKTDSFTVEDRRGKLYQKNHPPSLSDAVWRLENIGKDGAFHDRLSKENINTVKDFMTLFYMDCPRLQQILGRGMSTAMWKVTVNHAQTYIPVPRLYFYCPGSQQETGVVFSVVGQVMGLLSECQYTRLDKLSETEKGDAHDMVIAAFKNWEKVVSFDDEASLINASAHFFSNVLHANSADIKVLTSQEVGGFDCPQVSVCSPDNNPSIYSMGGVNRWDDFNFLDIDHLDPIYDGTWNVDGQVANSLGAGCSFQSGKSDLQSVVDRFSVAFAQRRWTMLFSVLKWFSIRKDSARKTHVRRKQRLCLLAAPKK